jgi:hypothetical protein
MPEAVAGGSYIPQPSATASSSALPNTTAPSNPLADQIAKDAKGRVSQDVPDFMLAAEGIVNGDPAGMEAFDLGFFEDGTPAITIAGASIPIRHEQWMALLTQRNVMRKELRARMDFEVERKRAKDGIGKVLASAPSVPPQLGQLLLTLADMNPPAAVQETSQLLVSMSSDNGKAQIGRISDYLQATAVENDMNRLFTEYEDEIGNKTSQAKAFSTRVKAAPADGKPNPDQRRNNMTAFAVDNLPNMYPPKGLKASTGGASLGIFDIILSEGADTSELSRFDQLRILAANAGELWGGMSVAEQNPPPVNAVGPQSVEQFRKYLISLDEWSSKALKWDRSRPESIEALLAVLFDMQKVREAQQAQKADRNAAAAVRADQEDEPLDLNQ